MPEANTAVMEFLHSRRSRPAKLLQDPAPNRDALIPLLTAAARTPDHGKLEPWRFIVLENRLSNGLRMKLKDADLTPVVQKKTSPRHGSNSLIARFASR